MEREHCTQHAETDEDEREEHLLDGYWNVVHLCNLNNVHGGGTREIVDAEDADDKQCGSTHEHQRELHG